MDMLKFLLPTVFLFTLCVARDCRSGDAACVQTFGELSYCDIEEGSSKGVCAGNRGDTTMECSCGDCPIVGDPIGNLGVCPPLTNCPSADEFCRDRHGFYSTCDFSQADYRNPTGVCTSDNSRTSYCSCSSCPKGDVHCAGIFKDGAYFCGDNGFCRKGKYVTDTQCSCNQFSDKYCPSIPGEIGNNVCNNLRPGSQCRIFGPYDTKAAEATDKIFNIDSSLFGLCHPYDPSGIFYGCGCFSPYVHDGTERLVPVPPTEADFCPPDSRGEAACNEQSIGSRCKIGGTKSRWEILAVEEFRTSNEKLTGVCSPTDPFKPFVGCGCEVSYTQTQFDCPEGSAGNEACSLPRREGKCKTGDFNGLELEVRNILNPYGFCNRNGEVVACRCDSEVTIDATFWPQVRDVFCPAGSSGNDQCNEWVPGSSCKVSDFNDIESRFVGRAPEPFNGVCSSPLVVRTTVPPAAIRTTNIYGACYCDDTGVLPRFQEPFP